MTTHRIGLLAFEDCDAMDLIGRYEVLLTANRLAKRRGGDLPFEVLVVGADARGFVAPGRGSPRLDRPSGALAGAI